MPAVLEELDDRGAEIAAAEDAEAVLIAGDVAAGDQASGGVRQGTWIVGSVEVVAPLLDVADHVVKTPGIGGLLRDGVSVVFGVAAVPGHGFHGGLLALALFDRDDVSRIERGARSRARS